MPFTWIKEQSAQVAVETLMATVDDSDIRRVGTACSSLFVGSRGDDSTRRPFCPPLLGLMGNESLVRPWFI
jgi:hypothetical protein